MNTKLQILKSWIVNNIDKIVSDNNFQFDFFACGISYEEIDYILQELNWTKNNSNNDEITYYTKDDNLLMLTGNNNTNKLLL